MKKIIFTLATFFTLFISAANAQIRISSTVLTNVVSLFAQQNGGLKSDLIESKNNANTYASAVIFNGAIDSKYIEYFHPAKPTTPVGTRMQSVFYEGDDFAAAQKKFKSVYRDLNGTQVTYNGISYKLQQEYTAPSKVKTVTTINYDLVSNRRMIFSIAMFKKADNWIVQLDVYEMGKSAD